MTSPEETAAATARPIGSFGTRFMFDPATYSAAQPHGYAGLDFYIAGRCGVLGDVDADVVSAALGFFEPGMVRTLWEQGVAVGPPQQAAVLFAEECAKWGTAHFGADIDYAELAALAGRAIAAASGAALPLFAGWRRMPVPDDPKGAAAHQMNVLRELRGGCHLVAVVAGGVEPLHAVLAKGGPANAGLFGFAEPYPDVSDLDEAMATVEEVTGRLAAAPLHALDEAECGRLADLVRATRAGLV